MKRILLFSSGLDSLLLKLMYNFEDEECLFVDMGTKENEAEKKIITAYYPGVNIYKLPLSMFELENKIIPFRNHHLALIAANYGNAIYFAFTAGDTTKDKDYTYKAQMECILNYFSTDIHKVKQQGPFEILMPFKQLTKTEIIFQFLKAKKSASLLQHSVSCYSGIEQGCGRCRSCIRKFIAFYLNGLGHLIRDHPSIEILIEFQKESEQKNRLTELKDIKKCINLLQQ